MIQGQNSRYHLGAATVVGRGDELILCEHHKDSDRWHYRCFDRILLNGLIQRVVGFFNTYRQLYPVTQYTQRDIADQFQRWVKERAAKRNIPIVEAPAGRRDEFVDPYFERVKPDAVVDILKAREPARIMTAIGVKSRTDGPAAYYFLTASMA